MPPARGCTALQRVQLRPSVHRRCLWMTQSSSGARTAPGCQAAERPHGGRTAKRRSLAADGRTPPSLGSRPAAVNAAARPPPANGPQSQRLARFACSSSAARVPARCTSCSARPWPPRAAW